MLQIASGRFFEDGKINEDVGYAVLFSNYSWLPNKVFGTSDLELRATTYSNSVTQYIFGFTNRYETHGKADVLVMPHSAQLVEHMRLLASLYFRCLFHEDYHFVEQATRTKARHINDSTIPSSFVPRYFDSGIHGSAHEVDAFGTFLTSVLELERSAYKKLLSCLQVFFDGLESTPTNYTLAYSMFAYVLEAITLGESQHKPKWEDFDHQIRSKLDGALSKTDESVSGSIRSILMEGTHQKLMARFVGGTSDLTRPTFFREESIGRTLAISRTDFGRALKNLYHTRSKFVHSLESVQENLRIPKAHLLNDFFEWNHEPYFTLSGLVRLTRHALMTYIERSKRGNPDGYPWRNEIPGIITAKLAPDYWISNSEGFSPKLANQKFNGLLQLISNNSHKEVPTYPPLKPLMGAIEGVFANATKEDKLTLYATYLLYCQTVVPEGRPPSSERFIQKHFESCTKICSIQLLLAFVLTGSHPRWDADSCASEFQQYTQRKYNSKAISLPTRHEVAILLEIARLYLDAENSPRFREYSVAALEAAAGHEFIQARIQHSIDTSRALHGGVAITPPSTKIRSRPLIPENPPWGFGVE